MVGILRKLSVWLLLSSSDCEFIRIYLFFFDWVKGKVIFVLFVYEKLIFVFLFDELDVILF